MTETDFMEQLKSLLDANGYKCEIGRLDTMKGKSGVCIREVSRRRISSDYGGTNTYELIYQVAVRDRDQEKAEKDCWAITELLEDSDIESADGSYDWNYQEVYTSPQEMDLKETLYYCWHVRFNAEIRQKVR